MRRSGIVRWLALFTLVASPLAAQQSSVGEIPFESYTLDNGLRVILAQDRSTPVVAVDVWYDVGSRDERLGRSGFAHLFEHMMFQGSENVEGTGHMQLIERAGGSMNGSTTEDRTNYFQTLPSNRLNLGLWLEADRMRSLDITQENFDNQTEVVKEERRLRVDNSPYGSSIMAALYELPYNEETCFSYAHTVIGSMEDLDAGELEDVQEFFDLYYAPNNATLTVVGDFDIEETKELIELYYGDIPRGAEKPAVTCEAPFSHLPVREQIEDGNANLPAVLLTYGMPEAGHPDTYALSLLGSILGGGESSRMHQRLVKDERAAVQVSSNAMIRRGPGLFFIIGLSNQGVEPSRVESLIEEEIAKIRDSGVTADELEKAKNTYAASTVRSWRTVLGRAEALQHFAHFYGDPGAMQNDLARYQAVTLEDVQRVAREYLTPQNRATVITVPATAEEE